MRTLQSPTIIRACFDHEIATFSHFAFCTKPRRRFASAELKRWVLSSGTSSELLVHVNTMTYCSKPWNAFTVDTELRRSGQFCSFSSAFQTFHNFNDQLCFLCVLMRTHCHLFPWVFYINEDYWNLCFWKWKLADAEFMLFLAPICLHKTLHSGTLVFLDAFCK